LTVPNGAVPLEHPKKQPSSVRLDVSTTAAAARSTKPAKNPTVARAIATRDKTFNFISTLVYASGVIANEPRVYALI
jgi:hypothetical protein